MAAVMASGPGAALSHLSAAALWQIYESFAALIHVTTTTRSPRRLPGIRAHRSRRLDDADVTSRHGIPVTSVARTLVDLSDVLSLDRLLRVIREAEFRHVFDLGEVETAMSRAHGRRRLGVLADALARHRPGQIVREELEHRFQELLHAAPVSAPETNVRVKTHRRTYVVDCLWRAEGVAVELDGRAAHARAAAFEEDRARDAALSAIGLRPLRFTWHRITTEASEVIAELCATLAQATAPSRSPR